MNKASYNCTVWECKVLRLRAAGRFSAAGVVTRALGALGAHGVARQRLSGVRRPPACVWLWAWMAVYRAIAMPMRSSVVTGHSRRTPAGGWRVARARVRGMERLGPVLSV